jgi:hypothetical protein
LIAGVTPVIDKHWAVQADLGERFLRFRIRYRDPEKAVEQADANAGREKQMREELSSISKSFLSSCQVPPIEKISIEPDLGERIRSLAHLVALGRSRVSRDGRDGTIDYEPEPEVGTRIAKQLKLLAVAFACIYGQDHVDENAYELVRRVCRDTLPSREAKILETVSLIQEEGQTPAPTSEIGKKSGFPTETCKKVLEDFRLLQIAEREGERPFKWTLTDRFWYLCQKTGLFIPF